jgi:pimeloyl-ACP methyl ester carboxylesterase
MTQENLTTNEFKGDVTRLSLKLRFFVAAMQAVERIAPGVVTRLMLTKFFTARRKKDSDYRSRLPAGAQPIAVRHEQMELTGWTWGETGPKLLVVHGWESHTGRMLPLIKPLVKAGYRVYAFDAPGHGLSPAAPTDLMDVSYAVQAMLVQHGPFDGLIAHSFGAAATTLALARAPHLAPEKLVLLSPMRDMAQHLEIFAAIAQLSPVAQERLQTAVSRRLGFSPDECSAVAAARQLPRPGLIIHDRDDLLIPYEVGQAMAHNWQGSHLISTDRLGHRRGLGHKTVLNSLLAYLTAVSITEQPLPILRPRTQQATFHPELAEKRQLAW